MKGLKYLLCGRQPVSMVLYVFCLIQAWERPCDLSSIVSILQIEEHLLIEINLT